MTRFINILICVIFLFSSLSSQIKPSQSYLETDPKPNMTENYIRLKLVKTLNPEINPDVFIYKPHTLTLDKEGNLYVFDRGQHKIVKLDKNLKFLCYIGNGGQGPGEFLPVPGAVFINIGLDNKLYCNDASACKIIVFDTAGKYLTDIPTPGVLFGKPTVGKDGQIYFFSGNDREFKATNQDGETILNIPIKADEIYSMLFFKQELVDNSFDIFLKPTFVDAGELLVYFSNSSTMIDISKNKIARQYRILPKDMLLDYKKFVKESVLNQRMRAPLFSDIIPDCDERGIYYLRKIINHSADRSLLYQMNLKGELLRVYYIDYNKSPDKIWIMAKKNHLFYAKKFGDEVIELYKAEE